MRGCAMASGMSVSVIASRIVGRIIILSNRKSCHRWLAIQPGHRADRAAGAALDFDREADEAKTALTDQLIEIDQPFHVGEAHVAANVMHLEVIAPGAAGAHRFDAEHPD